MAELEFWLYQLRTRCGTRLTFIQLYFLLVFDSNSYKPPNTIKFNSDPAAWGFVRIIS